MFLPVNQQDIIDRGIDCPDFTVISGDAYVDHPTFGHAVIARLLESLGFSVAIIAQPQKDSDYLCMPAPRHAFMVTSGVVDSMVNNYTASKARRTQDDYSEGGVTGKRPDRALTVYCTKLRQLFKDVPIVIGGLEASLRRLAHYDYFLDDVMPSILVDTGADLLIYGMGEQPIIDLAESVKRGIPVHKLKDILGTAYLTTQEGASKRVKEGIEGRGDFLLLSSFERVKSSKTAYHKAFMDASREQRLGIIQKQDYTSYVVVNPPQQAISSDTLDRVCTLPYMRRPHPMYIKGVPAIEEVEFSITAHRGCFGGCSFCALTYHQGRQIVRRSADSIVEEARALTAAKGFKGYIHDIGGPTANFHNPACANAPCNKGGCIGKSVCKNLVVDHSDYLSILRRVRALDGVKKVFVRSGVRFDYLMLEKNPEFFEELVRYHISGQLKVAPEHVSSRVLSAMNKSPHSVYLDFSRRFKELNQRFNKQQFLVPYFISGHPGCKLEDAIALYEYLVGINYMPLQVQDFYPTPSTLSTTMYYTGLDEQGKPIFTAKTEEEKALQRALLQYRLPKNRALVLKAFDLAGRKDLKSAYLKRYCKRKGEATSAPKGAAAKKLSRNRPKSK